MMNWKMKNQAPRGKVHTPIGVSEYTSGSAIKLPVTMHFTNFPQAMWFAVLCSSGTVLALSPTAIFPAKHATNVCVESTLRDGFHLEYFGVLLEDATHHLGPDFVREASLYNVEKFFGWVSNVADFCGSFGQMEAGTSQEG